ncbi:hypothetical protein R1sor_015100 [Riccia sorocarpa]|uniref:Uncharacterized protein n=1 Tax=Riccia sorocarpa TaxID=122646 RepID=A0ABD3HD52_9MARC
MPRSIVIVDYKDNGDGDAVLLCHDSLHIVERAVSGKGFAAWAKILTSVGIVGILNRQSILNLCMLQMIVGTGRKSVEHRGARALSDHVPIKLEVMLKEIEMNSLPRKSYFKMEHKMLMKPEVLERATGVWLDHPLWAKDKRKRWALALSRIRKLLMEIRDEERRREDENGRMEERLEIARIMIHHHYSEEARKLFEDAVTAQRQREHEEA